MPLCCNTIINRVFVAQARRLLLGVSIKWAFQRPPVLVYLRALIVALLTFVLHRLAKILVYSKIRKVRLCLDAHEISFLASCHHTHPLQWTKFRWHRGKFTPELVYFPRIFWLCPLWCILNLFLVLLWFDRSCMHSYSHRIQEQRKIENLPCSILMLSEDIF